LKLKRKICKISRTRIILNWLFTWITKHSPYITTKKQMTASICFNRQSKNCRVNKWTQKFISTEEMFTWKNRTMKWLMLTMTEQSPFSKMKLNSCMPKVLHTKLNQSSSLRKIYIAAMLKNWFLRLWLTSNKLLIAIKILSVQCFILD
jgi:hypothetical protein